MEEKIIEMLSLHTEQIIGVLGVLFFLGFEVYLILSNKKMLAKKRRCTGKTIGTVIHAEQNYHREWHKGDDDEGRLDHLRYSYTLEYEVGGNTYTLKGTSSYSRVGEKMKVYYNPKNPEDYHLGRPGLAIWANYIATVVFVFGIVVVIRFAIMGGHTSEGDEDTIYEDNMVYGDTVLMGEAQADQVCIAVEPSILREYSYYYYIPKGEDQKRLQQFMETLKLEGKPYEGKWEEKEQVGWRIAYNDMTFNVFEGGYLQDNYIDETGELMEHCEEAPELCSYIQNMLQEKLDYDSFNPANIENIVSAKLDIRSRNTNDTLYSQTITDKKTLQLFEDWFRHAEYMSENVDCDNQDACLELKLANGETVRLSVATDGCANFGINGVYYEYLPSSDWDSKELFERFDEIPWDWDAG